MLLVFLSSEYYFVVTAPLNPPLEPYDLVRIDKARISTRKDDVQIVGGWIYGKGESSLTTMAALAFEQQKFKTAYKLSEDQFEAFRQRTYEQRKVIYTVRLCLIFGFFRFIFFRFI